MNDLELKPTVEPSLTEEKTEDVSQESVTPPAVSAKAKTLGVLLPVALLCVGFIVGLLWFARPRSLRPKSAT